MATPTSPRPLRHALVLASLALLSVVVAAAAQPSNAESGSSALGSGPVPHTQDRLRHSPAHRAVRDFLPPLGSDPASNEPLGATADADADSSSCPANCATCDSTGVRCTWQVRAATHHAPAAARTTPTHTLPLPRCSRHARHAARQRIRWWVAAAASRTAPTAARHVRTVRCEPCARSRSCPAVACALVPPDPDEGQGARTCHNCMACTRSGAVGRWRGSRWRPLVPCTFAGRVCLCRSTGNSDGQCTKCSAGMQLAGGSCCNAGVNTDVCLHCLSNNGTCTGCQAFYVLRGSTCCNSTGLSENCGQCNSGACARAA